MIDKLKEDFKEVDFSFILPRGEVTYNRFNSLEEFSDEFFQKIDEYGFLKNVQVLIGESFVKYETREILSSPVLVCFVSLIDGKLEYEFMGVIE